MLYNNRAGKIPPLRGMAEMQSQMSKKRNLYGQVGVDRQKNETCHGMSLHVTLRGISKSAGRARDKDE